MAKFADYEKQKNEIDTELEEVQAKKSEKELPESVVKRFDGKSIEDVMEAYANLEQLNSRQGTDLGKLRKTVDQLLELQSVVSPSSQGGVEKESPKGITVDDLYDNPEQAIATVATKATKETSDRVKALEQDLAERTIAEKRAELSRRYKDWESDISDPEFVEWVNKSGARQRLAAQANAYDFDAANDLLELWNDKKSSKQTVETERRREQQFRAATLESSSPAGTDVVETFSRSDLINKRIAQKNGNMEADNYLRAHSRAINLAYEEGRITD